MLRHWFALVFCVALGVDASPARAQGVLSRLGELSVDGASLDDPRVPMPRRIAQARALGRWGEPAAAVSVLTETLARRPSEPLRSAVIAALAERRSVQAVAELLRALRGRAGSTAWLIQALSTIGGPPVIEAMSELAKQGDRSQRDAALRVLVRIAPDRAAPLMLEAWASQTPGERERMLPIAVAHPHGLWLSVLEDGLREARNEGEAATLTWSLTRVPEGAGLTGLLEASNVSGELPVHLRVALAVALRAHKQHVAPAERQRALDALQRGGSAEDKARTLLLATGEATSDEASADALDPAADPALHWRKVLRIRGDTAIRERVQAARALGRVADPKAHVPLIAALEDPSPDVRRTAVVALARLGRASGRDALHRHEAVELDPEVAEITARALQGDPIALDDPWFLGRQLRESLSPLPSAPAPVDRQVAPLAR